MNTNPKTKFSFTFIIRFVAVIVILAGVAIAAYAAYGSSNKVDSKQVFADRTMLSGLWNSYKDEYWESGSGRTIDRQSGNITTSEGQSYTMLRAVWQSDKATFDKTWGWTKQQLQRPDHLFSWRWGKLADGSYGILNDQGGQNSASDADSDIALALVMAASRWQQQSYLNDAKAIIGSIWTNEVVHINDKPYLVANNLEKADPTQAIINPSYIAPANYRIFAGVDTAAGHDWNGLVASSYSLLNTVIDSNLDKSSSAHLPPDWVVISKLTGDISAPTAAQGGNLSTNYGYEAFRIPWRLALDYRWNKADEAKSTLAKMSFLSDQWSSNAKLSPIYSHDGKPQATYESTGAYGGDLGYFILERPSQATDVYNKKLKYLYDPNKNAFSQDLSYYDANWAWFGMALYTNQLDNLAAGAGK